MTTTLPPAQPTARFIPAPPETYLFSTIAIVAIIAYLVGTGAPPVALQIAVIGVLAALFGLPHGALDPLIARRLGIWSGIGGFAAFNLVYLASVGVVVGVWLLAPVASLIAFLAVSASHFGADWNRDRPLWLRIVAGVALLSLPSFGHRDEVAALYETLAPGGGAIASVQFWIAPIALVGMLVGAALAIRRRPNETIELVLAAALAVVAPPLIFFVIYFCALHSARHLREGFRAEARGRVTVIVAVAYTVVPIIGAAGILLALMAAGPTVELDARLLQVVFIGLAGLTVPHMILVALESRADKQRERSPGR